MEIQVRRSAVEPGLSVCSALHQRGLKLSAFGLRADRLPSQVGHTLRELGVVSTPSRRVDPIAEILQRRYAVPRGRTWNRLLGTQYVHAIGLLKQAEATFAVGRSFWLACQNSFNQTLFLAIQRHLAVTGHPGACKVTDKNGQLLPYGVTLDASGPFSRNCPNIGICFREMNSRRNRLPVSHPYEKKTATQSQHLSVREQNGFVRKLRTAYADLVALMP